MTKFKKKYRIESNRLKGWDYSHNGFYFITIITQNRECYFGTAENRKIILSDFGKITNNEWLKSFEIRSELILDEYVIMPNHIHAIVAIQTSDDIDNSRLDNTRLIDTRLIDTRLIDTRLIVETHGRASLRQQQQQYQTENKSRKLIRKPKSISTFIAGFKSGTINKIDDFIDENNLKIAKFNKNNPLWQSNYHDHIIRNEESYYNIKNYIANNPMNWENDENYN